MKGLPERERGYIDAIKRAAERGAKELLRWRGRFDVSEKGVRDLVTDADMASQRAIHALLSEAYPEYHFVGEESTAADVPSAVREGEQSSWIVDPLDGTMNYVHGLPGYAVSIALWSDGLIRAAGVLDPLNGDFYWAVRGHGAWLNDERITVSRCPSLAEALVACSFPPRVEVAGDEVRRFLCVLPRCQGVRRLGSAALNLSYVAAGRLDGYWATSVKAWDVAAGFLLVTEAGGTLQHLSGERVDVWEPYFCATANEKVGKELMAAFAARDGGTLVD